MLTRDQVLKLADVVAGGEGDGGASLQDWIDTDAALRTTVEVQNHENNRLLGDLIALRAENEQLEASENAEIERNREVEAENERLIRLVNMANEDCGSWFRRYEILRTERAALAAQLAAMTQERDDERTAYRKLSEQWNITDLQLAASETRVKALEGKG